MSLRHIVISRTDRIGDVVLTLPLAGALKMLLPHPVRITFLGAGYTRAVVACCRHVDDFVAWDEIAHDPVAALKALRADAIFHVFPAKEIALAALRAGIPLRVGTRNRWFHWLTCNRLLALSRRTSDLHESQLNLKFLESFGIQRSFSLDEIYSFQGLRPLRVSLPEEQFWLDPSRFNVILHPKSKGSTREWPLSYFTRLAELLPPERFQVFITGTKSEGNACRALLERNFPHVRDVTGRFSLEQFIEFIAAADGLVAVGTGPVHLAAGLGCFTIGLFPPLQPIHPGRWQPVGPNVQVIVGRETCTGCPPTSGCPCMNAITPQHVAAYLEKAYDAQIPG